MARRTLPTRSLSIAVLVLFFAPVHGQQPSPEQRAAEARILREVDTAVTKGPFAANWASLEKFEAPAWYQDGKFGIFIHWGVYSVPAFGNEWYPRNMYKQGEPAFAHHVETFGPQGAFGYKDFIPKLTADKYDPRAWAALFKAAGARYVVPVAEHHDGFAMYDSALTEWCAGKMGPKRDLVGELAIAVRGEGLVFGLSSHRAEHWWFFGEGRKFDSDVRDPRYAGLYGDAADREASEKGQTPPSQAFMDDWLARTAELVDKYHPQLVWFDWWIAQPAFHPNLQKFAAFYYNRGAAWKQGVAINYKKHGGESFPDTAGVLDIERGQLAATRAQFWQTDTAVSKNSWGYVTNQDYKASDAIVDDLIDIVSKNGSLLLNIGPKPDGTIPEPEQRMLREIGQWLGANGEAIYGTRPWTIFGEGPTAVIEGPFADTRRKPFTAEDIRFTKKGDTIYAIALAWPASGKLTVHALGGPSSSFTAEIDRVDLLGSNRAVKWTRDAEGLHVELPAAPLSDVAVALRVTPKPSRTGGGGSARAGR
jgi:alpha-L-fucosidase